MVRSVQYFFPLLASTQAMSEPPPQELSSVHSVWPQLRLPGVGVGPLVGVAVGPGVWVGLGVVDGLGVGELDGVGVVVVLGRITMRQD